MLFRMISGSVGGSGNTAFLHLNVVGVEFNVLGAVEDAFGVVVGVWRNSSGALAADCGGEVVVAAAIGVGLVG